MIRAGNAGEIADFLKFILMPLEVGSLNRQPDVLLPRVFLQKEIITMKITEEKL